MFNLQGFQISNDFFKKVRWSSSDVPSIIRWKYRHCFRCNLLVKHFVILNCSNVNHNAMGQFFPSKRFEEYYSKDKDISVIWHFDSYIVSPPYSKLRAFYQIQTIDHLHLSQWALLASLPTKVKNWCCNPTAEYHNS